MRIAYVCADAGIPVFGRKGSSVHVQEMVRALCRRGAHVALFAARLGGAPPPELRLTVHVLEKIGGDTTAERERAALRANDQTRAALEASGPFDLVYERYSLWSHAGMEHARRQAIPGILEVNAPLIDEQANYRELVDRVSAERVAAQAFSAASALVAVSDEVGAYLRTHPETDGKVHVIPNGVDPARFAPSPAGGPVNDAFTIVFVGTLKPWHGLDVLAEAFAMLHRHRPRSRLLVVGDGPERAAMTSRLDALGALHATRFTGAVDPAAIPDLLASAHVGVAPYSARHPSYFSPLKVYEYMAAGLAVVATPVGQLRTLIRHGENGLSYAPDDPAALTSALERLHDDGELRASLGRCGRRTVVAAHTWDAVAGRVLDIARGPLRASARAARS